MDVSFQYYVATSQWHQLFQLLKLLHAESGWSSALPLEHVWISSTSYTLLC